MIKVVVFVGVMLLGGGVARADIKVVVATDGSERLVIARAPDVMTQMSEMDLVGSGKELMPYFDMADCKTLGSRQIAKARTEPFTVDTAMGQYNAVNLWLGRVCHGKSDASPTPQEARAWLDKLVNVSVNEKPLLQSHQMMAELLLFGAPGTDANPPAALTYLLKEAEEMPGYAGLFLAYMYENGVGVPADPAKALEWIDKSAAAGEADGQMMRAQSLELGLGRPRDEAGALKAYAAIKTLAPVARFREGLMYLEGRGTKKDPCKAKKLLTDALNTWAPSPQAKPYLARIEADALCAQ